MKRNLMFLIVVMTWWFAVAPTPISASVTCTTAGADIDTGWYCSDSPGDSEHECLYNMASRCSDACSACGRTFVSSGSCSWHRTSGSAPSDSEALSIGCTAGNWGQQWNVSCTCSTPPSCKEDGQACDSNGECCSDVCSELRTCGQPPTPILIGLESNSRNYHLTSVTEGVRFDLNANGFEELVAWTQASSEVAFLAMDRNSNGRIDDGSELFGNLTPKANGQNAANGFVALADLDLTSGNGDGIIDAADAFFGRLRLWTDRNHNGVSEFHELHSMHDGDITAIATAYRESRRVDRHGNRYKYVGTARAVVRNGLERRRAIFDVIPVTAQ